jgi:hypothetical protein
MNSDLPPCRSGAHGTASGSSPIRPHWREASNLHAALFADEIEPAPTQGEIWSIRQPAAPDAELLLAVIIAVGTETTTVVPVSTTVGNATEWDLVLPIATLGYGAVVQPKLAGSVAPELLERRLSTLMPESRHDLDQLLAATAAGQAVPPEGLPVGPWVLSEDDPRLAARAAAAEQLSAYLTLLAPDPISEWRSLGAILMRGSRATGIELSAVLDQPRWASRLQNDQLNPFALLPPRKMAELLKALRIGWSERVRDAVYRLASQYAPKEVAHGVVFGRRQGTRSPRRSPARAPDNASVDPAGDYVRAVERELGGR